MSIQSNLTHRPHQMRAWYASEMIDAGAPTIVVARALRHADEQSVGKYVRVKDETIAEAQNLLPLVRVPVRSGRKVA